jgi:hypothetical protein
LVDIHLAKTIYQRLIVSRDQNVFAFGPVASADVDSCAKFSREAFQYAVHQFGGIGKFGTRITAGC